MKIIGISGKKKHGKDAVADCIENINILNRVVRIAFADALKQEVAKACGVTVEFINKNKDLFRPILQWWGTEFRRKLYGENYWIFRWLEAVNKVPDNTWAIVCPDVRFKNEFEAIKQAGGYVIRVTRDTIKNDGDAHASETELDDPSIVFDDMIPNNGTLVDLRSYVTLVLKNIEQKYTNDSNRNLIKK